MKIIVEFHGQQIPAWTIRNRKRLYAISGMVGYEAAVRLMVATCADMRHATDMQAELSSWGYLDVKKKMAGK